MAMLLNQRTLVPDVTAMPYLSYDLFVDADTTPLTAHPPNVGPWWNNLTGSCRILSNAATGSTTSADPALGGTSAEAVVDVGQATVTVQATLNFGGAGSDYGLMVRASDASNYWLIWASKGSSFVILYEIAANVVTQRASSAFTFAASTNYAFKVVCSGTTITISVGGTQQLSYASASSNQTATKVGLRFASVNSSQFTNWQVTSP